MKPQSREVLQLLKRRQGYGITSKDALERIGCARLASRIYELREEGYSIAVETVKAGGAHVARYRLI
jgi:hypothetical protein